jgi:Zn-dependent peptidase ImmA (M78 family)
VIGDPSLYAVALLEQLGIHNPPDVLAIAAALGIGIEEPEVSSFDGALVRVRGSALGIIAIRRSIREPARKRFTVAHELGHLLLPGHDQSTICNGDNVENWAKGLASPEVEANQFASELLMPSSLALRQLGSHKPSFDVVDEIVHVFGTSLTASAYRFAELTSYAAAVVWSTRDTVRWFKRSGEFGYWIRVRERLDHGTLAHDLFINRDVPTSGARVPAAVWLDGDFDADDTVLEQSRPIPSYDGVLTLLSIPEPLTRERQTEEPLSELDPTEFTLRRKTWPTKR